MRSFEKTNRYSYRVVGGWVLSENRKRAESWKNIKYAHFYAWRTKTGQGDA